MRKGDIFREFKKITMLLSSVLGVGWGVLLSRTVLVAYRNNGQIIININEFGEGLIELFFVPFVTVLCCIGVYYISQEVKSEG